MLPATGLDGVVVFKVMVGDFDTAAGKRGRKLLCPWKEMVWGFMVVCNVT